MCVQYRGGDQYLGGYLEYYGGVFSTVGRYHEYRGGCSVPWRDIMMHVGDIMSTVGGVQYHGGYHPLKFEYRGWIS